MAEAWHLVVFWVLAVAIIASALRVVTTGNLVHAALYLVGTLMGAATLYLLLLAEFIAWVQVLVYVGAIVVLMLFGLMLTRAPIGKGAFDNDQRPLAAVVALAVFVVSSLIMVRAFDGQMIDLSGAAKPDTKALGNLLFTTYVLPFEVVSVLLLAALVGAVVIARKD